MKIPYTHSSPDPEVAIVLEVGKKYGIDEAMVIYTSKVEVKDFVLLKCKYGCENYGKSHTCPPDSIPPEKMKDLLREYKRAILVVAKAKDEEEQTKFRKALIEMESALCSKDFYKSFALVPGCCSGCDVCGHEEKGCKEVHHRRPCIEGTGIDVFSLIRKHKKNIQTVEAMKKAAERYGLILLD